MADTPVRIGLLAASRIARRAVVDPAARTDGVEVVAVAARSLERAQQAADRWQLPIALGSYDELVAHADVDAVYVGTPNALHRPWAVAAVEAGKHVLVEKPIAANADDARLLATAATASDRVVMEAFHTRYHPWGPQVRGLLADHVLGPLEDVEAWFELPEGAVGRDDIRWDLALGGGAMMDLGVYPAEWLLRLRPVAPAVVTAQAECPVPGVDGALDVDLVWPDGVTASIHASMIGQEEGPQTWLQVEGRDGFLRLERPTAPHRGGRLTVTTADGLVEHPLSDAVTFDRQLVAFRDAVRDGTPFPTTATAGVEVMELVDDCYRAAGLEPRPTWAWPAGPGV